jgi:pimeloyl-ACP methyl ester carboxylesterase
MEITKVGLVGLFLFGIMLLPAQVALSQPSKIVTETIMVPASDAGIQLHVRNKHPEGISNFGSDRIVLFVHGATYCAESGFDLPLNGLSWMDYVAQRGWDVYIMDVRGYGRSTRPAERSKPAAENPPIVNTDVAVKDVGAIVDHILARRKVQRLNLLGHSWGTAIMGAYTAVNNANVERLVLYGPMWLIKDAQPMPANTFSAYRTVTKEEAKKRMVRGIPPERQKEVLPDDWFDAWWETAVKPDPVGAGQNPPVVRAPNGVREDQRKYWRVGKPCYDPANITVPTLLIVGEWDVDTRPYMAQELFPNLKNTRIKRMVIVGEGTHWMYVEKNRLQLFREVQHFLEEPR